MKKGMKKKGFTLVELIVVVAVLGIIAAIAVPKFGNVQEKAKIKADIASAKTIADVASALIADGKISYINSSGVDSYAPALVSSDTNIKGQLQAVPEVKLTSGNNFVVDIDGSGNVIVYANVDATVAQLTAGNQVYPKPGANDANFSNNPYYK